MLDDWTIEMKEAVAEYRASNHTLDDSFDWLYLNYPDATRYKSGTFKKWLRTSEGRELLAKGQVIVKQEASAGVAEKDNRILAVIEVTTKIMESLRKLDATDKSFVPLNRELRENLKYIAEETGDRMSDPVQDAYQMFKANIESNNEWKQIAQEAGLIQKTPSN